MRKLLGEFIAGLFVGAAAWCFVAVLYAGVHGGLPGGRIDYWFPLGALTGAAVVGCAANALANLHRVRLRSVLSMFAAIAGLSAGGVGLVVTAYESSLLGAQVGAFAAWTLGMIVGGVLGGGVGAILGAMYEAGPEPTDA